MNQLNAAISLAENGDDKTNLNDLLQKIKDDLTETILDIVSKYLQERILMTSMKLDYDDVQSAG